VCACCRYSGHVGNKDGKGIKQLNKMKGLGQYVQRVSTGSKTGHGHKFL
jgi:hypothetical protein